LNKIILNDYNRKKLNNNEKSLAITCDFLIPCFVILYRPSAKKIFPLLKLPKIHMKVSMVNVKRQLSLLGINVNIATLTEVTDISSNTDKQIMRKFIALVLIGVIALPFCM